MYWQAICIFSADYFQILTATHHCRFASESEERMKEEMQELYKTRINEVLEKLKQVQLGNIEILHECYAAAVNIFEALYSRDSVQLDELLRLVKELRSVNPNPGAMDKKIATVINGQLSNVLSELQTGLIQKIYNRAIGEAIGDFIFLAHEALEENQKDVAAVLASAALEDAMKNKATSLGLDVENKELSAVVNALKSKSFFQGAQHKVVSSFVKLRNNAMHANWDRVAKPEVEGLVAFVKSFAIEHF
jgi:hypothetical protein